MTRLKNLSHIDFEDLCRDILQAETGNRFSAFASGPDGGVDGRHSKGEKSTVLQCKHYAGSSYSNLKSSIKREIPKLEVLKPTRYYFCTSQALTPAKQDEIAGLLFPYLADSQDVWGQDDIEGALRRNPDIEKSHIKLWLSSAAVLQRVLKSGLEEFTNTTRDELLEKLKVFVRNPSLDEAMKKLEAEKTLIVAGPPGVGKTTLAYMVSYQFLSDGWRFVAINSLDDGFEKIDDDTPTSYFCDEFLGRIELNRQSLLQRDNQLAMFVGRVRRSQNARFILTTRAHIFEEARNLSDRIDDGRLQLSKYLLDVGIYTRKVKAEILYNHLEASGLTQNHFASLVSGDWLKKIVDHKNYNPRIIAHISSDNHTPVDAESYPDFVMRSLEHPDQVWDKPYKNLDFRSQNLLIALFFGGQFGQKIQDLRDNFMLIHRPLSEHYGSPTRPDDFEQTLKALETGFVSIYQNLVHFVNPSVRDYLKAQLTNMEMLEILARLSKRSDWASSVWDQIKYTNRKGKHETTQDLRDFPEFFQSFAKQIEASPSLKYEKSRFGFMGIAADDLALSNRIKLLISWWECSGDDFFLEKCLSLLEGDDVVLDEGRDGYGLLELNACEFDYIDCEHPLKLKIQQAAMQKLLNVLDGGIALDSLTEIAEALKEYDAPNIPVFIHEKIDELVAFETDDPEEAIRDMNTESELSEHIELIERLASARDIDVSQAVNIMSSKIADIEEHDYGEYRSSFRNNASQSDAFSDSDLSSMFSTLLKG